VALKDWHIFLLSKTNILEKEKVLSYLCLPLRISLVIPFSLRNKERSRLFPYAFLLKTLGTQFLFFIIPIKLFKNRVNQ
jgi:hypothetical protein